jgi:hypothetical protein
VLRFLLWRLFGLLAFLAGLALISWFVRGGLGKALRGSKAADGLDLVVSAVAHAPERAAAALTVAGSTPGVSFVALLFGVVIVLTTATRLQARHRRRYVRLRVVPYRTDRATAEAITSALESIHKRLLSRWWRRLLFGQPAVALEVHHSCGSRSPVAAPTDAVPAGPHSAWLAVSCPRGSERMIEAALRDAYPNCRLCPLDHSVGTPPVVLRLKKRSEFIKRVKALNRFEHERTPPINGLITAMGACGEPAFVQLAMTPTPAFFDRLAKRLYKHHEARLSRARKDHVPANDRSMVEDAELRGGLDVQHRPLFFADLRVVASNRAVCERIASELRAEGAENRLVERGTAVRHGLLSLYGGRVRRGEGNPLPPFLKGVFASPELAAIWHLPSVDYATVPFARTGVPVAPAPPSIMRPREGGGTLRDSLGAVSIHPELRNQNTAVPGAVDQGKSSYLIATVAEDLQRKRCAVIVLDPKGDAADVAVSLVPVERDCTLLDFARPTCGFNPLAVDAPADVIADYVVAALKNLFTDADIRASSDRYLRNAIIAVLAFDRESTLWDAARLLSVGEEGYSYRRSVGAAVRALPEFKEISAFFTAELTAQLADARSMTTAKLDAPVNKLARLLNSSSIKRVLLNDSLRVDFDRIISGEEVLVVRGALGVMGAGNTSVLMQLLVGMLDAALARQQDLVPAHERVAVALKVDEAPLVLNRGFAETMALKRSAGLETVACWQVDAQWTDQAVRDQLDALFAHRVYFATASARDARAAVDLTMAEFSDTVRPGIAQLATLGRPDVRLHLPKHHAIASWSTHDGRQAPFVAQTMPLTVDQERLSLHVTRQLARGGRHLADLTQPHWERAQRGACDGGDMPSKAIGAEASSECAGEAPSWELPAAPAETYRELVELDGAHSVRWARPVPSQHELDPDRLDLEMLALIANLGHVLTSQVHRQFNPGRAATTTQRRLKRLSDASLVERFQFHRRDGGGVPMCYVITEAGLRLLLAHGLLSTRQEAGNGANGGSANSLARDDRRLRQARHDVHVAGWTLALSRLLTDVSCSVRGTAQAVLSPPLRTTTDGRVPFGPGDLRLPGGRAPHDFLRTTASGERIEAERFETVRPDAIIAVDGEGGLRKASPSGGARVGEATEAAATGSGRGGAEIRRTRAVDVIVELDDRLGSGGAAAKIERYDHFLAGWSVHTVRYGRREDAMPEVVFVCRDRRRARQCAKQADVALSACRAYAGEYPFDWEYPGRERTLFAAERDVHEGLLCAYGVPRLPARVRVTASRGDPRAGEALIERREILGRPPARAQ